MFLVKMKQPLIFMCLKQATLDEAKTLRDLKDRNLMLKGLIKGKQIAHWHFIAESNLALNRDSSSEQLVTIPDNVVLAFNAPPLSSILLSR